MAYATISQVKAAISLTGVDTLDDMQITSALTAAESLIDGYCERSFAVAGTAATSRVYAAETYDLLFIDDATTVTLVETSSAADGVFDASWSAADWQGEPLNGISGGLSWPYTRLRAVGGRYYPRTNAAAVRVTGTWGWAAVPGVVTQATIQQTLRLWKRLDSALGFAGGPETGLIRVGRSIDADVAQLLAPYRRNPAGGVA
jgi:hypothetical protein